MSPSQVFEMWKCGKREIKVKRERSLLQKQFSLLFAINILWEEYEKVEHELCLIEQTKKRMAAVEA